MSNNEGLAMLVMICGKWSMRSHSDDIFEEYLMRLKKNVRHILIAKFLKSWHSNRINSRFCFLKMAYN